MTLFSTHYHELTSLEKKYKTIKNVHVSAVENEGQITFLHKVKNGAIDKSYGIHVAKLAGMPEDLLKRANEILTEYETISKKSNKKSDNIQLSMDFIEDKKDDNLKEKIMKINPLEMTPIEALNYLYELKNSIENK